MAIEQLENVENRQMNNSLSSRPLPSQLSPSTFPSDVMSITLADDRAYYTNLDEVSGTIRYKSDLDAEGKILLVRLMGITYNSQIEWHQMSASYKTVTTEWPFLKHTSQVDIDLNSCESRFSFRIPSYLQPRQCPVGEHSHLELPPSMNTDARPDDCTEFMIPGTFDWKVAYQIRAELISLDAGIKLGHVTAPFHFVPQYPEEKREEASIPKKRTYTERISNLVGQTQGSMALAIEDDATLFTTGMSAPITTRLPLSLRFEGKAPPKVTKITATLLARTIKRTRHSPMDYSAESRLTATRDLQSFSDGKAGVMPWSASNCELHTHHSQIDLPLTLLEDAKMVVLPSFESCLVSMSYELRLTLSLASSSAMPLRQRTFQFPIRVATRLDRPISDIDPENVPTYETVISQLGAICPMVAVPEYTDPIPEFERLRQPFWHDKCKPEQDLIPLERPTCCQ